MEIPSNSLICSPRYCIVFMKIISINVRGLGVEDKIGWVRGICSSEKPDLIALQETKCKQVEDRLIHALWGNSDCGYIQKEAVDNSGGMLLVWDIKNYVAISACVSEFFLVVKGHWKGCDQDSIIVHVYGPHDDASKKIMWESLDYFVKSIDAAWLVCGEFNEVREPSDRLNCVFHQRWANRFNKFIAEINLIEIPISGRKLTRISDDGLKFSKIDRFLASDKFINLWDDLSVIALDRKESDHCSVVLRDKLLDYGPKPFEVFNEWFNKEGVEEVIKEAWKKPVTSIHSDSMFGDHLKNVKYCLKQWSNATFGNLDKEIGTLKLKVEDWGKKAESCSLNDIDRADWLEARRCWIENEKSKTKMLKQKARSRWKTKVRPEDGDCLVVLRRKKVEEKVVEVVCSLVRKQMREGREE
ncbi:uncharacterized protein [Rutidosis leptorrhynchoides]|uniref:uncharacterized protein n=1 Tax=Rutidosis leptorrhynchoides TaxID=125765 RepID=UPI003A9A25BB